MFDWIAGLFGGGNKQKNTQSTPKRTPGPSLGGPSSLINRGASIDLAAQAREEERRLREEERKAREAAAAAKKLKEEAEAKAKQVQQSQKSVKNPMQFEQPATGGLATPRKSLAETNKQRPISTSKFSDSEILAARQNPNAPFSAELKEAAASSKLRTSQEKIAQHKENIRKSKVTGAKAELFMNQLWAPVQSGGMDIAKLPGVVAGLFGGDEFAEDWSTAIDQSSIPLIGGQWRPTGDKTYTEIIADTERAKDMAMNTIYRNGGELSTPEKVIQAGAEVFGSLVSPTEASSAIKAGTKLTGSADELVDVASLATGGATRGSRVASNASDAADVARRLQIEEEARRAAAEAEDAVNSLPDPIQIEQQATDAGRIDDGISSPSRVQQAQQTITNQVEQTKAAIQEEYQNTLMGLNDLMNSMTPRPLAMQMAGAPGIDPRMMARQADFDMPEQVLPPEPMPDVPVPSKTPPIAQAIETPNQAASKAAAEATPPVPPKATAKEAPAADGVKTRTIDDMSDDEIMERFGTTREEMVKRREAARATKEAEEARKAEKQKAKEERAAQRAAATQQAAMDAGEAPSKDIFANKKRSDSAPTKTKPEKATVKAKDILAGKKKADAPESISKPITKREKDNAVVDSLFEKGETLALDEAGTNAKVIENRKNAILEKDFDDLTVSERDFIRDVLAKEARDKFNEAKAAGMAPQSKQYRELKSRAERAERIAERARGTMGSDVGTPKTTLDEIENAPEFEVDIDGKIPDKPSNDIFAGKKKADKAEPNFTIDPKQGKTNTLDDDTTGKGFGPKSKTSGAEVPKTPTKEAPAKTKDIFADKKRTVASAKETGNGGTPPPTKTPPKKAAPDKPPIDTDYIREKAKTGEKTRSTSKTGANNEQTRGQYDKLSRAVTRAEAENFAKNTPVEDFIKYALAKKRITPADENVARAYQAMGRATNDMVKGQLKDIRKRAKVDAAQDMATFSRFDKKTATRHEINSQYEDLFEKYDFKTSKKEQKQLDKLSADYTTKRDAVKAAREKAIGSKSNKDIDALERAVEAAYQADRAHQLEAYNQALRAAKKAEKSGEQLTEGQFAGLKALEQKAAIFQYDAVDASLLSATGTMFNNFVNGVVTLGEAVGAGKGASRLASKFVNRNLKGADKVYVGGYSTRGAAMGFKEGVRSIRAEVGMRNALNRTGDAGPMKKAWGAYKNTVTTANELSETTIRARIQSKTYDHYMQINKNAGMTGNDLKSQSRIDALTDPLEKRHIYEKEAYLTQGMSALSDAAKKEGVKKVERSITDAVSNALKETPLGNTLKGRQYADYAGKMTSRFFVGFPSVVWKSGVVAGAKRMPILGYAIDGYRYSKATNPQEKAQILAEGLEHAASGAGFAGVGLYLGMNGIVTGAYPSDPNEQKRWQAEGKTEWSIKLGSDYYDIRKSLGAFALPVMMYAQLGQNMADKNTMNPLEGFLPDIEGSTAGSYAEAFTKSPLMAMWGVTPVEGPLKRVNDVAEIINGQKGWADLAATATRMHLPAAGFMNQLAKMYTSMDSGEELEARTKDNSLQGQVQEFINRIAVAVPGGGEALGLDAKQSLGVDQTATSVIGRIFGAQKGYNPEGAAVVQRQRDEAARVAETTRSVSDNTFDKILETMDEDTKGLYKRVVQEGKTLKPENQKQVDDAIAGLADGDKDFESKFSEEGDWETQDYILQKKKQKYEADKSTKPEKIREIEREIGRTDILRNLDGDPKENATLYKRYKEVSQSELNKMLDEEDEDNYNPELAMKLVAMDEMFTKANLSWKTDVIDGWTKKKYDLEKAKKGRGGGGSKDLLATDVSGLKVMESEGLSNIKYKTVAGMPNLMAATPRKNFKKTISIKRGVQL